jgi:uncharacterized membrane-anchored protein
MMNPKILFALYTALAIVQLGVPAGQIWRHEDVLRNGVIYKLRTAPVDPYDAFRGRYVALNYADTVAPPRSGENLAPQSTAYVALRKDKDGFAQFSELSATPPVEGDYLRVEYLYSRDAGTTGAHFRLPFNRYYMEESKAPRAETAYWKHGNRRNQKDNTTYVTVRIKNGRGVIENLFIQDKPILEFLAEDASTK